MKPTLVILYLLFSFNAQAASLFKDPGAWLKDTGRAIDNSRRKIDQGVLEVVTVGEIGRQRDRERAEADRKVAQERLAAAEASKSAKIEDLQNQITANQVNIKSHNYLLEQTGILRDLTGSMGELLESMATEAANSGSGFTGLITLVKSQLKDLQVLSDNMKKLGTLNTPEIQDALYNKVIDYRQQVESFPTSSSPEDIEELVVETLEVFEELSLNIEEVEVGLKIKVKDFSDRISDLNNRKNTIENPPKPKPKKTISPSPVNQSQNNQRLSRFPYEILEP